MNIKWDVAKVLQKNQKNSNQVQNMQKKFN